MGYKPYELQSIWRFSESGRSWLPVDTAAVLKPREVCDRLLPEGSSAGGPNARDGSTSHIMQHTQHAHIQHMLSYCVSHMHTYSPPMTHSPIHAHVFKCTLPYSHTYTLSHACTYDHTHMYTYTHGCVDPHESIVTYPCASPRCSHTSMHR